VIGQFVEESDFQKWLYKARTRESAGLIEDAKVCWEKARNAVSDTWTQLYCSDQINRLGQMEEMG